MKITNDDFANFVKWFNFVTYGKGEVGGDFSTYGVVLSHPDFMKSLNRASSLVDEFCGRAKEWDVDLQRRVRGHVPEVVLAFVRYQLSEERTCRKDTREYLKQVGFDQGEVDDRAINAVLSFCRDHL